MFQNSENNKRSQQHIEEIERLKRTLQSALAEYQDKVEKYTLSKTTKWEFTQMSTKDKNFEQRIAELGLAGWEMVGVASFTEGGTLGGLGSYAIHFQYAFKRQIPDLPSEITEKHITILRLQEQIRNLESQ